MKTLKSLIFCLIVILGVSSFAKAAPLSQVSSTILYVKQGGTSVDCSSWDAACDLQTALSIASSGDQVRVAAGTYKPTTPSGRFATFQLGSGVAIYGGFPAAGGAWADRNWLTNLTTLSGDIGNSGDSTDNSYHVVTWKWVDGTEIMDGFTISGGNANSGYPHASGGGMVNSSSNPTLTNVTFSANSAKFGGGMYNESNSSPTLTNVTFFGNSATVSGAGMFNSSSSPTLTNVNFSTNSATNDGGGMYNTNSHPELTNVTFSGNTATWYGGGMFNISSSPTLTNVTFSGNSASENGGGMFNESSSPTLTNVTFSANPAYDGGGMFNNSSNPTLTNVTFSGNSATNGGGMTNWSSSPALTNVTFSGNPASNNGGGMYNYSSSPTLTNVTFFENSAHIYGGGMINTNSSSPTLTNAIVWGNTNDQIYNDSSTSIITFSDIQYWVSGGTGNINADPLLGPLADNGGFTQTHALGAGSPAINAGNPGVCPTFDQRGYIRPIGGRCDMGAFEYGSTPLLLTLTVNITGSGSVEKNPNKSNYLFAEVITLTATANPGWTFTGWGGDASGTINPLAITMSRDKSITANFTQDEYSLVVTVDPEGKGSVSISPEQTNYHYGDVVTLTAAAGNDWAFSGWSVDATGTDNPLTVTIYDDTSITANWEQIFFRIYIPIVLR